MLLSNLFKDWVCGGVLCQLRVRVLIVDVVADPDKLAGLVGAGEQHHGHPHHVLGRDLAGVRGISLERDREHKLLETVR